MKRSKVAVLLGSVAGLSAALLATGGDAQTYRDQCYRRQGEPADACTVCMQERCSTGRCCLILQEPEQTPTQG